MKGKNHFLLAALLLSASVLMALGSKEKKFDIYDCAWLEGMWVGTGLGGSTESIWSASGKDGTMMGVFRHFNAKGISDFYQFLLLDQSGLRVKHFSGDLKGWEKKEDCVTFKMVGFSKGKIEMGSLIYEQKSENEIEIRLIVKSGVKKELLVTTELKEVSRML